MKTPPLKCGQQFLLSFKKKNVNIGFGTEKERRPGVSPAGSKPQKMRPFKSPHRYRLEPDQPQEIS